MDPQSFLLFILVSSIVSNQEWTYGSITIFLGAVAVYLISTSLVPTSSSNSLMEGVGKMFVPSNRSNVNINADIIARYLRAYNSASKFSVADLTSKKGRVDAASEIIKTVVNAVNGIVVRVHTVGHVIEWKATVHPTHGVDDALDPAQVEQKINVSAKSARS